MKSVTDQNVKILSLKYELTSSIGLHVELSKMLKAFMIQLSQKLHIHSVHIICNTKELHLYEAPLQLDDSYHYPTAQKKWFLDNIGHYRQNNSDENYFYYWRVRKNYEIYIIRKQSEINAETTHALEPILNKLDLAIEASVEYERAKSLRAIASETEKVLNEAIQAAEGSNRAKGEFLANMSHELRTPLNGILGMTQILLQSKLTFDQQSDILTLKSSAETLLKILNDILDFSKIEVGKLDLENIAFNLRKELSDFFKLSRSVAVQKNIDFEFFIDQGIPEYIFGDPLRIKQIVMNLVNNAIKFTSKGHVKVNILALSTTENLVNLKIEVIDSGVGIPKNKLDDIFLAFNQADSSTTRKYGGTGLGLSICAQLAHLMGGAIYVNSLLGQGSTFVFTVTLHVTSQSIVDQSLLIINENKKFKIEKKQLKILLAEDNLINKKITFTFLKRLGHLVDVADNGRIAVEMFEADNYDLILMDIQMPEVSGFEATFAIREIEKKSSGHIPIIALTAHALVGDKEKCLDSGMDDYLTKPLSYEGLEKSLSKYL